MLFLALFALLVNGASIPKKNTNESAESRRHGKTLGLLTVAGQALGSGLGTAAKVIGIGVGVASAIAPLTLLGVGKCELMIH